ncbi:MAG: helix-turn-helix domain-containing protein [Saprospiraceae bacterium]
MNHLIIWKELYLFLGINQRTIAKHQHPLIQLIVGVDGPFLWKDEHGNWVEKNALLVAPNQAHECDAKGQKVAIVSIDPASLLGEFVVRQYLNAGPMVDFSFRDGSFELVTFTALIQDKNWNEVHQRLQDLFNFDVNSSTLRKKEERIQNVLDYIHTNIDHKISTKILMEVSHLSESRLLHLFKQIMGLPIRNYILWRRIQIAFHQILNGNSLTESAYLAGFSDQAHLTRTFVKTIGLPPSAILKNSKFVQVFFPA